MLIKKEGCNKKKKTKLINKFVNYRNNLVIIIYYQLKTNN